MSGKRRILWILGLGCLPSLALIGGSRDVGRAAGEIATVSVPGCWTSPEINWPGDPAGAMEIRVLSGVGGSSPDDVWVVGSANVNDTTHPISAHWDGHGWNAVDVPATDKYGVLYAVSAEAPDDVWAVGTHGSSIYENFPFIVHWNGTAWTQVAPPAALDSTDVLLSAVAAVSHNDVWIVGRSNRGNGTYFPLIMHWNGSYWTLDSISRIEGGPVLGEDLYGVAAISANNVWAVGGGGRLHWDGTTWKNGPVELQQGILQGMTVLSANNIWVAGTQLGGSQPSRTLILHWDGNRWQGIPTPNLDPDAGWLTSIAVIAPDDIWAAGYMGTRENEALLLHWDGRAWGEVSFPDYLLRSNLSSLVYGAFAVGGDLWLVGDNSSTELLVRHTDSPCAVPPTATPRPSPAPHTPLNPPVPLPGAGATVGVGSLYFPETGKTVSGVFLRYWQQHGGLLQNGYPLSEVIGERSDLDGQIYTVQYFERAEFEYHPELKGTPYEVLLSQLGTFRFGEKYSQPWQKPQDSQVSPPAAMKTLYFPQTGKTVGGVFLDYWQAHGSVEQLGLPISNLILEKSDMDNNTYTVQYFERAELEYHPENAPPYKVLQAQLGRYRYNEKYDTQH